MSDDTGDPIGYQVLAKGTPVVFSDGTRLGDVARVLDNAREHIFDGLVVRTPDGAVFVDAPEVQRIFERQVLLNLEPGFTFPPYRGLRGRVEHTARRRAARLRRTFGR